MASLLLLAILPVAFFAVVALQRIGDVATADGDARASGAATAVRAILTRDSDDLQSLVTSYVTWDRLRTDTAALDTVDIAGTVIDFQVARGTVDAALLEVGDTTLAGGDATIAAELETYLANDAGGPTSAALGGDPGPVFAAFRGGIYELAIGTIDLTGLNGPGVLAASSRPALLAFAVRLDSAFVVRARQLTGFDVAVYDLSGNLMVASNAQLATRAGRPNVTGLPADGDHVGRPEPGIVAAGFSVAGIDGTTVGAVLAMTDLRLLGAIGTDLVPFLAVTLALTLILALLLSVVLSRQLRIRLGAVRAGIAAVARGDLTTRLPEGDRDEIERLAGSHNRLAAMLERRDRMIWGSSEAIEQLHPERGADRLAADGVEAARRIFGLEAAWLRTVDGAVVAASPPVAIPTPEPNILASLLPGSANLRLEGRAADPASWSASDRMLFDLFVRDLGVVIRDAGLYAGAARRADRLGRINRLQQDFLQAIGHNLRSPLTRILMASDDLRTYPETASSTRARAESIHADAARLSRIVGQLLTLSRLDAGAYEPAAELLELAPLARRSWDALASDRPFSIVDHSSGAFAVGDRAAVEQVLWILLDNAVTYAPNGPVRVTIETREAARDGSKATGTELVLRVADQGPGVPAAERTRIFGRFQRGSTAEGREVTGLGLDVARGLLSAMGGRLWLETTDRPGATFAFALPAEPISGPA
ncbi:MAG: HAMP domain-containing protein [Chloroflexi bacterium]|nr:HAMP domain-containing protein [Chloroflexota bacterium]